MSKGNLNSRVEALERSSGIGGAPYLMTFDFKFEPPFHWFFENYEGANKHSGLVRLTDDELRAKFSEGIPDRVRRFTYAWGIAK